MPSGAFPLSLLKELTPGVLFLPQPVQGMFFQIGHNVIGKQRGLIHIDWIEANAIEYVIYKHLCAKLKISK